MKRRRRIILVARRVYTHLFIKLRFSASEIPTHASVLISEHWTSWETILICIKLQLYTSIDYIILIIINYLIILIQRLNPEKIKIAWKCARLLWNFQYFENRAEKPWHFNLAPLSSADRRCNIAIQHRVMYSKKVRHTRTAAVAVKYHCSDGAVVKLLRGSARGGP